LRPITSLVRKLLHPIPGTVCIELTTLRAWRDMIGHRAVEALAGRVVDGDGDRNHHRRERLAGTAHQVDVDVIVASNPHELPDMRA
jgi:hypothetical protein